MVRADRFAYAIVDNLDEPAMLRRGIVMAAPDAIIHLDSDIVWLFGQ
jgi:hypothetical protein